MTRKASKFKVGLFVLVGVLLMVSGLIWLGASRYLKGSTTYATYFAESVQGLQMDSVVKYRGVEVGRVKAIRVAPDNTLIEVVMDIVFKGQIEQTMVASLKMVGITGIAYVELDQRRPGAADQTPPITFASEYPIIPSRPSEISQILTVAEEVVQQVRLIDFKKLADELEAFFGRGNLPLGKLDDAGEVASATVGGLAAEAVEVLEKPA
jgi:phospholipid/cholesterol/gamma-HCH transport system substrate-binding protein